MAEEAVYLMIAKKKKSRIIMAGIPTFPLRTFPQSLNFLEAPSPKGSNSLPTASEAGDKAFSIYAFWGTFEIQTALDQESIIVS
jgi:hypothetical protein